MSLKLSIEVPKPRLDTLEGLTVELTLENRGATAVSLPAEDDVSGAWGFEFFAPSGELVRRADGETHQWMMSTARVDREVRLDALPPGGTWRWSVDLATYHYGLPVGVHRLEAVCRSTSSSLELRSNPVSVEVAEVVPVRAQWSRDNSVLDGLVALFELNDGGRRWRLRQHNAPRPLAAWYSEPVELAPLPSDGDPPPFTATASFFRTDTFDHFFDR
ncbi:MAG: hypothetical protein KDC38_00985 [Planctomycetes bacterium]|nr:hypothetical protein [Planctomycetota bacterium]